MKTRLYEDFASAVSKVKPGSAKVQGSRQATEENKKFADTLADFIRKYDMVLDTPLSGDLSGEPLKNVISLEYYIRFEAQSPHKSLPDEYRDLLKYFLETEFNTWVKDRNYIFDHKMVGGLFTSYLKAVRPHWTVAFDTDRTTAGGENFWVRILDKDSQWVLIDARKDAKAYYHLWSSVDLWVHREGQRGKGPDMMTFNASPNHALIPSAPVLLDSFGQLPSRSVEYRPTLANVRNGEFTAVYDILFGPFEDMAGLYQILKARFQ